MPEETMKPDNYKNQTSAEAPEAEVADIESLKEALAAEKSKAESYLASWQRAQADFINYKRRMEQERGENAKFAAALLIKNLLPILDDMERALAYTPSHPDELSWVEGVRLIYSKFKGILEAQGLSPIKALGEAFDPTVHEAMAQAEGEEGVVIEEVQKGYKLHDRVLRPSLVIVGRGTKEK